MPISGCLLTFENQKKMFFQVFSDQKKVFCRFFLGNLLPFIFVKQQHTSCCDHRSKKNSLHLLTNALHTAHCTPKSIVYQTFEPIEEKINQMTERSEAALEILL